MTTQDTAFQPETVAATVYKKMRYDIIHGVFPPGTHLVKRNLAKKYGVSVPPVIEACLRLENDGLVESSPLVGAFVPKLTHEKLAEEHIFREAIECQIAREFALRASDQDRALMMHFAKEVDDIERGRDPSDAEVNRRYQQLHSNYHVMLAKLCRVNILYQQVKKVWFRRLMFVWNVDKKRFPTPPDWHITLTNALNSGNPERADMAMRHHFNINTANKQLVIPDSLVQGSSFFSEVLSTTAVPGELPGAEDAPETDFSPMIDLLDS
ncbi:MAG: GntR family transcriptional regulator [Planctomycetota bacterium]|jgi:DNA-binding GntR family transcriptional regulator|nr:GntR family transcriptional regulator [Planctomycetota bacterium]